MNRPIDRTLSGHGPSLFFRRLAFWLSATLACSAAGCRVHEPRARGAGPKAHKSAPPSFWGQGGAQWHSMSAWISDLRARGRKDHLRVAFYRPRGALDERPTDALVRFSEPVAILAPEGGQRTPPVRVEPPVRTKVRWLAGDTLKIVFEDPLRFATSYRVTVGASRKGGTRLAGVSGARLAKPFTWSFETPRPKLVSFRILGSGSWIRWDLSRWLGYHGLWRKQGVLLRFNQPIPLGEARRHLHVFVRPPGRGTRQQWPVRMDRDPVAQHETRWVLVTPVRDWPNGGWTVTIEVDPQLRGAEGPLPAGRKAGRVVLKTPGPLRTSVTCKGSDEVEAAPDGSTETVGCWKTPSVRGRTQTIGLRTSEPVSRSALLAHLQVLVGRSRGRARPMSPKKVARLLRSQCPVEGPCRFWRLAIYPSRQQDILLRVRSGLEDVFGNRLAADNRFRISLEGTAPGFGLPKSVRGYLDPARGLPFAASNMSHLEAVVWRPTTPVQMVRLARCLQGLAKSRQAAGAASAKFLQCLKGLPSKTVPRDLGASRNRLVRGAIPLGPGLNLVHVVARGRKYGHRGTPPRYESWRLFQATRLGVHVRRSPGSLLVWVTSLATGLPVKGARVSVYDQEAAALLDRTTDADGLVLVTSGPVVERLKKNSAVNLLVWVRKGRDQSVLPTGPWARGWQDFEEESLLHQGGSGDDGTYDFEDDVESALFFARTGSFAGHVYEVPDLSAAEDWEDPDDFLMCYLDSDRGIYRPGDEVYLKGAVRRYVASQPRPTGGMSALVVLQDPEGRTVAERPVRLGKFGDFEVGLRLPPSGPLGQYAFLLEVGGRHLARLSVKVSDFRAPRFTVHMKDPGRWPRLVDEGIPVDLRARTFTGLPLDRGLVRLSAVALPCSLWDERARRYGAVGLAMDTKWPEPQPYVSKVEPLDAKGRFQTTIRPPRQPLGLPTCHNVVAEVMSLRGQIVSRDERVIAVPADRLVAIERRMDADRPGKSVAYALTVLDRRYEPVPGTVRLAVHAVSRTGWRYSVPNPHESPLWQGRRRVPAEGLVAQVPWHREWEGHDLALVVEVQDAKGRVSRTMVVLDRPRQPAKTRSRPGEPEEEDEEMGGDEDESFVELRLLNEDDSPYTLGTTALLELHPHAPAAASLFLVEGYRTLYAKVLRFRGRRRIPIKLKVTEAFFPSVQVRAVATRRGPAWNRVSLLVSNTQSVEVDTEPRRLVVRVSTDRPVYAPRQRVGVTVRVADRQGRPVRAAVLLSATDAAVLQLTGWQPKNPFRDLLPEPGSQVDAWDLRTAPASTKISMVYALPFHFGGGGGGGFVGIGSGSAYGTGGLRVFAGRQRPSQQRVRRKFATTVWHARLLTDSTGTARASFRLADNLTTYRITAAAVGPGWLAGLGTTSLRVTLPLFAVADLPRHVRPGDEFLAGVVVRNASARSRQVRVSVEASGPARLEGHPNRDIHVPAKGSKLVRFQARATGVGRATFRFHVTSGAISDTVEQSLTVRPVRAPGSTSVAGVVSGRALQRLGRLDQVRHDVGGLELRFASTMLAGAAPATEMLRKYRYSCLEQSSAKLVGVAAAKILADKVPRLVERPPRAETARTLYRLLALQTETGGFAFWPRAAEASLWGTAWALVALDAARQAHIGRGKLLARRASSAARWLVRYLREAAEARTKWRLALLGPEAAALSAYALSVWRVKIPGPVRAYLTDAVSAEDVPPQTKALLLAARAHGFPLSEARRAAFLRSIFNALEAEGAQVSLKTRPASWFDSPVRATAMTLLGLSRDERGRHMASRLARWLATGRRHSDFRTTQEAAWSLLALLDHAEAHEATSPVRVGAFLAGRPVARALLGPSQPQARVWLRMSQLVRVLGRSTGAPLQLESSGPVYYLARLRYALKGLPAKPESRGFQVERTVERVDVSGRRLPGPLRFGDVVLVTLKVSAATSGRYVVVEDPLPGGLEPIDLSLATERVQWGLFARLWDQDWVDHRELRDDRVSFFRNFLAAGPHVFKYLARVTTPGRFVWPPARAEQMYFPEIFGRTGTRWVDIRQ